MQTIVLTRGYKAVVDDVDFQRINRFSWFACVSRWQIRAARQQMRQMIYMHHQVLDIMPWELDGEEIDHNDRNPLNNRRNNLIVTNHTGNMRNTRRHLERKGYCYNKRASLWTVYLDRPNKARLYLGYTKTEEEAILRIEEARLAHH